ncbi:hypothetical protein [Hymenobacter sp. UYP22]|uniref:hypothetical protein n=1 Tax=Hymenobacter sp. UYP22 TaxID=3156348 RepID=UPI003399636D
MPYRLSGLLALLSLPALVAQAQTLEPETPPQTSKQALKIGLRVFEQPDVALSYERWLPARWSLSTTLGYFPQHYTSYGLWYTNAAGQQQPTVEQGVNRYYNVDVQARYYFRRRTAGRPLTGWYAALVLHGSHVRTTREYGPTPTTAAYVAYSAVTRLQPQLQLGRQWGLGSRLVLDTFVGTEILRRALSRNTQARYQPLNRGAGLQLGYRF